MLPGPNTPLCELDRTPLSPHGEETLLRLSGFLCKVGLPVLKVAALLCDYSKDVHQTGVYYATHLAGRRPFWEWREWRSLRPPVDPDVPEQVARLDSYCKKWEPLVHDAVMVLADAEDRDELLSYLERDRPSVTWRSRSWMRAVSNLKKVPVPSYQATWEHVRKLGFDVDYARFQRLAESVQDAIRQAPLHECELEEIHEHREEFARRSRDWLDQRRQSFQSTFDKEQLSLLALGEPVPQPLPDSAWFRAISSFDLAQA